MRRIISIQAVAVCLFLSLVGIEQASAQTSLQPSAWDTLTATALKQMSNPATLASHLKYQIVALDAQNNGKINLNTSEVLLILQVTNDSPNYYNRIIISHPDINLLNTVNGTVSKDIPFLPPASITISNALPYSTFNVILTSQAVPVGANVFNSSISASTLVIAQLFNYSNTSSTPDGMILSVVENSIYEPSNSDLIPLIYNNLTNIGTNVQNIWKKIE